MKKKDFIKYLTEGSKEPKEATGASSAGGFQGPAFSMWSEDDEAKKEYKKSDTKKVEATEATGSSSVGAYDAPGFEDVNMRGNNPVGSGKQFKKPLYKGGDFAVIKKGCKTFPYCSQGNSKDKPVKLTKKLSPMNEAIENVSKMTGISVEEIKNIILSKINNNL